ncbi:MAG: penicillin-binding protein 2 [Phenylobacterium sp.]|jgi:penicillin-binding protein 2
MPYTRITIRDHSSESNLFARRAFFALLFVITLIIVLLSNMYHLQIKRHETYTTRSNDNRISIRPIAPNRGLIFDRNGKLLAENRPTYSLEVIPEQAGNINELLKQLVGVIELSEEQQKNFVKSVKRQRRFKSVVVKNNLTEDEVAKFSVQQHHFVGLSIEARLTRFYPYGDVLTHAIGYVGKINKKELVAIDQAGNSANYAGSYDIGKQGIERFYENQLHGKVGYREVEVNSRGRILRTLNINPPTPGNDLTLTLDMDLQKVAQDALKGTRGAVVAIDATNGGILAFYSNPSYDPNLFVHGISTKDYRPLITSKDRPLINRVTQGRYPPASTAKPLMALLGLESELVTKETKIRDPGFYRIPKVKRKYRDWKPNGHGNVDVYTSIEQSCDIYFYDLSYKLGIDQISTFMARFGFGEKTGVDIFEEVGGILPSRGWKRAQHNQPWYAGDTISVGIGQGYWTATPLQLAFATATLANKGVIRTPHFVQHQMVREQPTNRMIVTQDQDHPPIVLKNPENWDIIIEGMRRTNHGSRGTARKIFRKTKYQSAGKTGTAQRVNVAEDVKYDAKKISKRNLPNAMYIGFAPVNNPKIVIAVAVENGEHGSSTAAPMARKLMDRYFASYPLDLPVPTPENKIATEPATNAE